MRITDLFILQNIWRWLQRSQSFIVLITSLALTYYFWQESAQQVTNEASAYFKSEAQQTQNHIEERMRACEQILRGASGLFAASEELSREEFRIYINSLRLQENYRGIQGVGFSLIIPSNQLATHEATIRNQGFPNYVVKPPGPRQVYTSIIYLEPFADRNLRAFGYDMFSEPVRRAAMERARDTGLPALSGKVVLMQERDTTVQAGTLLYIPVYKNGYQTITVEDRRANIIGWVYSPYRMTDLMSVVLDQQLNADFGVEFFDDSQISAQSLLYQSVHIDHPKQRPTFYKSTVLSIAGQQWTMVMHTLPGFGKNLQLSKPHIVASAGIIASLLLFLLTWQLAHGLELALKIVKQRETQFKTLFDYSLDAVLLASPDGKVLAANPAATKLFGYTEAELQTLGRPAIVNMSDPRLPDFLARRNRDGFTRGELTLKRKDGSTFEGEISSSIFTGADTQVQASVIVHDITERKQAELKNLALIQRNQILMDNAIEGIHILNDNGHVLQANKAFCHLLGYSEAEALTLHITDWEAKFTENEIQTTIKQLLTGQAIFETLHRRKDGGMIYVEVSAVGVTLDGKPCIYASSKDITERKRAELEQLASQQKIARIVATVPGVLYDYILYPDSSNRFLFLSLHCRELFEIEADAMVADSNLFWNLVYPEDLAELAHADQTANRRGDYFTHELRITTPSGVFKWIELSSRPNPPESGQPSVWSGHILDITARKQAEWKLQESERKFRQLIEQVPIPLCFVNKNQELAYFNPRFVTTFGYSNEDIPTLNEWWQLAYPDPEYRAWVLKTWNVAVENALTTDSDIEPIEYNLSCKDGTMRIMLISGITFSEGVLATFVDMTERKQTELALLQARQSAEAAEQFAHETIDALSAHLCVVDATGNIILVNRAWREFADANGSTMENYGIGHNYLQVCKSATDSKNHCLADNFCDQLNSMLKGETTAFQFEYPCHSPTEKRWFNAHVSRFSQAPLHIVIAHENITDRKLAEEKTKASEERMRAIIAAEPECIKILDQKGILLHMNPAGLAIIEADSLDQVIGQSIFKVIAQEYRKDYIALHQRVMMGESQEMEYEILGLKGSRRWLETHAVRVQDNGQWLHLAITRDISHRKQIEAALIKARQDAEAANIAKSAFLANMSHEIRTPMNGILGMAQMLLQPNLTDQNRQDYAKTILNSGRLLLNLLNDILDLSKVESGKIKLELTPCQPKRILNEISLLFAENAKRKSLQFNCNWNGPALYYLSDSYRLQQMLSNLVTNAIKFTEAGQIDVAGTEIERNGSTTTLEFSVTDTGIGIAPDSIQLLFAPFTQADSSTTRRFGGTGLGLSIVKSLAKNMGGDAGCSSQLGQGSRFWFRISANIVETSNASSHAAVKLVTLPERFFGQILVAEDDLANTQVIQAMLHRLGLTVKTVNDGQQAVDAVMAGDVMNLILMDLQMPILDGGAATEKIRRWEMETSTPRRPIIALTASVFASNRQQCLIMGMDGFLTKPIVFDELKQVLNQWLDAKIVEKPNATTSVLPATVKPVNVPQVVAILRELIPALTQNSFNALRIFNNLSEVLVNTDLATEIELMATSLAQLQFHLALKQLRQIMANRGWQE